MVTGSAGRPARPDRSRRTGSPCSPRSCPGLRSAAVGIWVRAASAHEPPAPMGAAHLLEHLVFKGTERRPARDIARELEVRGGSLDAYTSRDQTSYQAHVARRGPPARHRHPDRPGPAAAAPRRAISSWSGTWCSRRSRRSRTPRTTSSSSSIRGRSGPTIPTAIRFWARPRRCSALAADIAGRTLHRRTATIPATAVIAAAGHVDHDRVLAGARAGRLVRRRRPRDPRRRRSRRAGRRRGVSARQRAGRAAEPPRVRDRYLRGPRPAALRPGDPHQPAGGRDVEPALSAGPGGAGARLHGLCLPALLSGHRADRGLRRDPAGDGGAGGRARSRRSWPGWPATGSPRRSWRAGASSSRARCMLALESPVQPDAPPGGAFVLNDDRYRPLDEILRDRAVDRVTRDRRGRVGGGVARSRAARRSGWANERQDFHVSRNRSR